MIEFCKIRACKANWLIFQSYSTFNSINQSLVNLCIKGGFYRSFSQNLYSKLSSIIGILSLYDLDFDCKQLYDQNSKLIGWNI